MLEINAYQNHYPSTFYHKDAKLSVSHYNFSPKAEVQLIISYFTELMELINLDAFRRYYNTHIFPELQRTERLRKRLLTLLFLSALIIFLILTISAYLGVVLVSLFLSMPITFYIFYLAYQVQKFRQT